MNGLERLLSKGLIKKQMCEHLVEELTVTREALSKPIVVSGETLTVFHILEVLEAISGELCELIDDRNRREGVADNPPEILDVEERITEGLKNMKDTEV